MTESQLDVRRERAENGALVVSRIEDGFRVYSIHNPSRMYQVRQDNGRWTCTCPDFAANEADPDWRCKHILAATPAEQPAPAPVPAPQPNGKPAVYLQPQPAPAPHQNGAAHMLIKRSVSPDGRIDSVSVEFSLPIAENTRGDIKTKALTTLKLQKEIVGEFLKLNGASHSNGAAPAAVARPAAAQPAQAQSVLVNSQPALARVLDIGSVNGKWGERLCLNVEINGRTSRLFGTSKQLAERIAAAGYTIAPEALTPGLRLNLACRATTKPSRDGRYLDIEALLPLRKAQGGDDDHVPF